MKAVAITVAWMLGCAFLFIGTGCVCTRGAYTPPPVDNVKQPTVTFYRFAVLYPFAVESVTFPGGVGISKYNTDGGSAGVCAVVDATGKTVGTFVGTAVKTSVLP